jgi:hypothetical protein
VATDCHPCTVPSSSPAPVPDGTFGTAATIQKLQGEGTQIRLTWDTSTCAATGYSVYYGELSQVSALTFSGSRCGIGTGGAYDWTSGVPAGDLFFLVVSNDGAAAEGSWGKDFIGGIHHERGGTAVSGQCAMAKHDNSATCP